MKLLTFSAGHFFHFVSEQQGSGQRRTVRGGVFQEALRISDKVASDISKHSPNSQRCFERPMAADKRRCPKNIQELTKGLYVIDKRILRVEGIEKPNHEPSPKTFVEALLTLRVFKNRWYCLIPIEFFTRIRSYLGIELINIEPIRRVVLVAMLNPCITGSGPIRPFKVK